MAKENIHVVKRGGNWAVLKEKAERVSSFHSTQAGAIDSARTTAQREKAEVVIHGKDGKIRDKDSYGHDPNPPKDTKL